MTKELMKWLMRSHMIFTYIESLVNDITSSEKRAENARFLYDMKSIAVSNFANDARLINAIDRGIACLPAI